MSQQVPPKSFNGSFGRLRRSTRKPTDFLGCELQAKPILRKIVRSSRDGPELCGSGPIQDIGSELLLLLPVAVLARCGNLLGVLEVEHLHDNLGMPLVRLQLQTALVARMVLFRILAS